MQNQKNIKATPKGQLPEKKIRAGAIAATIWKNQMQKGTETVEYFSVAFERNYKAKDGTWKSTNSLRVADIPKAILVLNKAYEFLVLKEHSSESSNTANVATANAAQSSDYDSTDLDVEDIY